MHPFKVGDFIVVNGQIGSVETKGLNTTKLKNIDGEEFLVSNTHFYTRPLLNLSDQKIVKAEFSVSVSYDQDMPKIKKLILAYLSSQDLLLKSPNPKISVKKIHSNHVELEIKAWCALDNYLEIDSIAEALLKEHLISKGVAIQDEYLEEKKMMA